MFKVTSNGIEELGSPIELTAEDHETIEEIFEESSKVVAPNKHNGIWKSRIPDSLNLTEKNYAESED